MIYDIQNANSGLFSQALLKNQRKGGVNSSAADAYYQGTGIPQGVSGVGQNINYENENFFETNDNKLFDTKNLMGY